jgi:hypothetical protein
VTMAVLCIKLRSGVRMQPTAQALGNKDKKRALEGRKKSYDTDSGGTTEVPHRFQASALSSTIYGVSLLTDPTGGSTLGIRGHSNQTS